MSDHDRDSTTPSNGELEITRQSVSEMRAGKGRSAEDMLADMRQLLDEKRGV